MQNQKEQNNYGKLFWLLAIILLAFILFNLTNSSASSGPTPQNIVQSGGANIFSQLHDTINNFKQILN
jgi:hypothetical protein